jgi:predicted nucleotidyltransferase
MNRTSAVSACVRTAALLIADLSEEHSQAILALQTQHPKVETVVLYGSWAMGRQNPGSDIDLCLQAPEMSLGELLILGAALDDLLLPWSIDLQLHT